MLRCHLFFSVIAPKEFAFFSFSKTEGQLESAQQHIEDTEAELERCIEEFSNLKGDLEHEVKVRQRSVKILP